MLENNSTVDCAKKAVEHCDVGYIRTAITKFIGGLGMRVSQITFSVDNSRPGYENSKLEFVDSKGRNVEVRITLRNRFSKGSQRHAVLYPMTYIDYHKYIEKINHCVCPDLCEVFIEFFNQSMTLCKSENVFEVEHEVVENDGYFSISIESSTREFLLQVDTDVVNN